MLCEVFAVVGGQHDHCSCKYSPLYKSVKQPLKLVVDPSNPGIVEVADKVGIRLGQVVVVLLIDQLLDLAWTLLDGGPQCSIVIIIR